MRTKLVTILVLLSVVLAACAPAAPAATEAPAPVVPTEAPVAAEPVATEAPAAVEPAPATATTLKIYLLDYTPDTIAWLEERYQSCVRSCAPGCHR